MFSRLKVSRACMVLVVDFHLLEILFQISQPGFIDDDTARVLRHV